MKNPLAIIGAVIIGLLVFTALFAPLLAPYNPNDPEVAIQLNKQFAAPGANHLMGCDQNGNDLFSMIIYGARVTLIVGLTTVLLSLLIGIFAGALAGYFGGIIDEIIMRLVDIVMAFPGILLAIAIIAVTQRPSNLSVILALSATGWAGYARLVRAQFLSTRESEFVIAAKALGARAPRIIVRHILPTTVAPLTVQVTFGVAGVILSEASLSFLGLGPQGTHSWGALLNQGTQWLAIAPHLAIFPGAAIMLIVLAFNFLGDGLRDWLDPKQYGSRK